MDVFELSTNFEYVFFLHYSFCSVSQLTYFVILFGFMFFYFDLIYGLSTKVHFSRAKILLYFQYYLDSNFVYIYNDVIRTIFKYLFCFEIIVLSHYFLLLVYDHLLISAGRIFLFVDPCKIFICLTKNSNK